MSKRKSFQELEISDAFLFAAVMEDEEISRQFLQIVLGTEIEKVWVRAERVIGLNREYRSVRLDVFVDDGKDSMYDLEMQGQKKKNIFKRGRYYQSQMDVADLRPRGDFDKLRKSCVIFICLFDPFKKGRYRYTFEERCLEEDFPLGDETKKIFLSTEGKNPGEVSEELVQFLKYVKSSVEVIQSTSPGPFVNLVDKRVRALKNSNGLEAEYMLFGELLDDERKEGQEEGKAEGKAESKTEIAALVAALLKDGQADLLPRLEEPDFLEKMLEKYRK